MLTPKNTTHNRKLHLLESQGKLLCIKDGIAYFYIVADGATNYYKCEEHFFVKNFDNEEAEQTVVVDEEALKNKMKLCKNYPY